ncbi:hypothetical protein, partial [Brucella sp. 22210]|uniref:hypothetical protein n=1 Tax=Brucella sp. 22210 TaxID=3453892 RepID=UPI003F85D013
MTIPEQAVQAAINAWFEETRPHVMNTTPLPEQARRMRLALTAATPFMMDVPCGYRLIPQQPTQTVLEIMAFNLSAEFGADFTRENQEFALAVYNEAWTHGIRPLDQSTAAAPHLAAVRVNSDQIEAARKAVEELAHVQMNLPLEDWSRISSAILSALEPSANTCPCTKIQQDETCPVGYPSLLCEICDGKGVLQPSAGRAAVLEEAAQEEFEIDKLRFRAFHTNSEADRQAY